MKRLSSLVRTGTLAKWLADLEARAAAGGGGVVRSAQGDTWLETDPEQHVFAGQVRLVAGGVRVLPFFWQLAADALSTHHVPTVASGQTLLGQPTLNQPSDDCVVSVVITGRIDDVSADVETSALNFTPSITAVEVQVTSTLPSIQQARISARRGVTAGDPGIPFFDVTEVQPEARYALPLATISARRVQHSYGTPTALVQGRGVLLVEVPVIIEVEEVD
jgi:hypothetical protein